MFENKEVVYYFFLHFLKLINKYFLLYNRIYLCIMNLIIKLQQPILII